MKTKRVGGLVLSGREDGATAVIVALLLVVFVAFTALAVDISHLYVVKNELQNAADAGALAGARVLYNNSGTSVNTDANSVAYAAAIANKSENLGVEVNWAEGSNEGDVQRGHWSFATRTFVANSSTAPPTLWGQTSSQLDADDNFINAVKVISRRENNQANSFFAGILGFFGFDVNAEAIAYIGFAGSMEPTELDMPIAICKQSLLMSGTYTCSVGRMMNSSLDIETGQTGAWTDFNQEGDPCSGGTNSTAVRDLLPTTCNFPGNPDTVVFGADIALSNGEIQTAFDRLYDCWETRTGRTTSWSTTLPVIDCDSGGPTCSPVVGAVTVEIIWMNRTMAGGNNLYNTAPSSMLDWSSTSTDGEVRWNSFIDHFNLKNMDGSDATWEQKTIYFRPECEPHEPIGTSGGQNFGILAKIPVLVD